MATGLQRHGVMRRTTAMEIIEAGTIAGLIGGVAMAAVGTGYAAAAGLGFWEPIHAITATLVGSAAAADMTATASIVAGLVVHLFVSVGFGVVFAALMPRTVPDAPALALGTFAGVAILFIMSLVILPLLNPVARSRLMWGSAHGEIPVWVAFAMHIVYGAGLALVPRLRQRFHWG
jgi:uncharacterized membrane protein YagU involved in acid resistance